MPWHCSICGRVYAKRNKTRREVLNNWWNHVEIYHPAVFKEKKKAATRKMLETKRNKGMIS